MPYDLLITCEHAGNIVPEKYKSLFINAGDALSSHEGWDPGAWEVALFLGQQLKVPPIGCHTSRLLIETNRSIDNVQLFSLYTNHLTKNEKDTLIKELYNPYRESVQLKIDQLKKPILHLSIHSFTPVYQGKERKVELGLLYDPGRPSENRFCQNLHQEIKRFNANMTVKHNEPYLGIDDGLTSYLRSSYGDDQYLGIEIEISQKFTEDLSKVKQTLVQGVEKILFP